MGLRTILERHAQGGGFWRAQGGVEGMKLFLLQVKNAQQFCALEMRGLMGLQISATICLRYVADSRTPHCSAAYPRLRSGASGYLQALFGRWTTCFGSLSPTSGEPRRSGGKIYVIGEKLPTHSTLRIIGGVVSEALVRFSNKRAPNPGGARGPSSSIGKHIEVLPPCFQVMSTFAVGNLNET